MRKVYKWESFLTPKFWENEFGYLNRFSLHQNKINPQISVSSSTIQFFNENTSFIYNLYIFNKKYIFFSSKNIRTKIEEIKFEHNKRIGLDLLNTNQTLVVFFYKEGSLSPAIDFVRYHSLNLKNININFFYFRKYFVKKKNNNLYFLPFLQNKEYLKNIKELSNKKVLNKYFQINFYLKGLNKKKIQINKFLMNGFNFFCEKKLKKPLKSVYLFKFLWYLKERLSLIKILNLAGDNNFMWFLNFSKFFMKFYIYFVFILIKRNFLYKNLFSLIKLRISFIKRFLKLLSKNFIFDYKIFYLNRMKIYFLNKIKKAYFNLVKRIPLVGIKKLISNRFVFNYRYNKLSPDFFNFLKTNKNNLIIGNLSVSGFFIEQDSFKKDFLIVNFISSNKVIRDFFFIIQQKKLIINFFTYFIAEKLIIKSLKIFLEKSFKNISFLIDLVFINNYLLRFEKIKKILIFFLFFQNKYFNFIKIQKDLTYTLFLLSLKGISLNTIGVLENRYSLIIKNSLEFLIIKDFNSKKNLIIKIDRINFNNKYLKKVNKSG